MSLLEDLVGKILEKVNLSSLAGEESPLPPNLQEHIDHHLRWARQWAEQVQIYGMSQGVETNHSTIPLRIAAVPRRFRSRTKRPKEFSESDIVNTDKHYAILGDPGAGKTTTIKRLVLHLLSPATSTADKWQIPIVLRLLDVHQPIVQRIADILGIKYKEDRVLGNRASKRGIKPEMILVGLSPYLRTIQGPLALTVAAALREIKPVILLDGLDEVSVERREAIEEEIEALALLSADYKLVVTCRSGDFVRRLDRVCVVEVCPLSTKEIALITKAWLKKPKPFLNCLAALPFGDLANRPLFLTQLMVFYERYGYLPEQPSAVYSKILNLMLEEWDTHRRISRASKYAGFNPTRKCEFLSAISFEITYRIKQRIFDRADLVRSYQRVCKSFNLPSNEAEKVASEIETHTGIVCQGTDDKFEFSHLSIQEFLCANYMARVPLSEQTAQYFLNYPAPLAITVAISANPSLTLGHLILSPSMYSVIGQNTSSLVSFLSRLRLERPYFEPSIYLGFALVRMFGFNNRLVADEVIKNFVSPSERTSLAHALTYYGICGYDSDTGSLALRRWINFDDSFGYKVRPPDRAFIPKQFFNELRDQNLIALVDTPHNRDQIIAGDQLEKLYSDSQPNDST